VPAPPGTTTTIPPAPPLTLSALGTAIDSVLNAPPLHRVLWGVAVMDPASGQLLYAHNAEKHFIPASNNKLVVTITALGELGPDYRYHTEVMADGATGDSTVSLLLVKGSGDPTMSARFDTTDFAPLDSLAASIAASGIRFVAGDIIIDATRFDTEAVHSTWEIGDLPLSYATPVGAFVIGEGTFALVRKPGPNAGAPATVSVIGGDALQPVVADVITDTARAPLRWNIDEMARVDTIRIRGSIALSADTDTLRYAVTDPVAYAGRAFRAALERAGIGINGALRIVTDTTAMQQTLASAPALRVVATRLSPPLSEIVPHILKPSQNWMADQLLKTLGAERRGRGTWNSGVSVERRYLVEVARLDSLDFSLRDGSGLSAQNLLSPAGTAKLLAHARTSAWGPAFVAALPRPGERGGTLSSRLRGLESSVAAKTGSITHVNSLSGFVRTQSGRELVFSIFTNGSGLPSAPVRNAIDAIVRAVYRLK
jgi:D-alanyl-D-alanine carboxypeptidase/D-alanyl-D-alanine-endopeptidase (penicillin-binding protein 4)